MDNNKHLVLIDGYGFVFRAYHSMPPLSRSDGTPVGAVYGFTSMLMKLVQEIKASHIVVIFDSGVKSFRNDIYPEYKANRPPPPDDLIPQFPLVREAAIAMNLEVLEKQGFEADDLIATYARKGSREGYDVTVVSSDKDLMQLVGGRIKMYDPMKSKTIGEEQVFEKFGVYPNKLLDLLSMAGDASDNIPGVPGIGPKTAAELINTYGSLDEILNRAEEIKQPKRRATLLDNKEQALLSRKLITLDENVSVSRKVEDLKFALPDKSKMFAFLKEQNFNSLISKAERLINHRVEKKPEKSALKTIKKLGDLKDWLKRAYEYEKLAIHFQEEDGDIVGIALTTDSKSAIYIPTSIEVDLLSQSLNFEDVLEVLSDILIDPAILKISYNIKPILHKTDIRPVDDVMLMSYVLDNGLHPHTLELILLKNLGEEKTLESLLGKGRSKISFALLPENDALSWATKRALDILKLHETYSQRLFDEKMLNMYSKIESPIMPILVKMEKAGVKVDQQKLLSLSEEFGNKIDQLQKDIFSESGQEFNIASPKQLSDVLFGSLGLEPKDKTSKTKVPSTSADVLEELNNQGHSIAGRILEWRHFSKLKNTYTDTISNLADRNSRVHTTFLMTSTSTGRLSSIDPNLQNIPIRTEEGQKIRSAFIAEPGNELISADYSQIELRLLSHIADIESLKKAFIEGRDIHATTASEVFGVAHDKVDSDMRRKAKAINFGIIYRISPFGLANQLNIPHAEAKQYIDTYFKRYPGILEYMETTLEFARKHGYVKTLFGRKCHFPHISDSNPMRRNVAERAAINAPLQGSVSDIIKKAMIKVDREIKEKKIKTIMTLQVHDELLFDSPKDEVERVSKIIQNLMQGVTSLSVPLIVDIGSGKNWSTIK